MTALIRCSIYTRQSRDRRQEYSSCDAQREACAAYIRLQPGWRWNEVCYDDKGESGENLDRPGLNRLLGDIRAGVVDRVVIHRLDRLSRKLANCAAIVSELNARGVPLAIVTSPELGTGATQTLMVNILASFAEFENEMTRERMSDARRALKSRGRRVAGRVPFGYSADPLTKQLRLNHDEARRVNQMFHWAAEGKSATEIANLASHGGWHTSPTAANRNGGSWTPRQVLTTLSNPIYAGRIRNGDSTLPGAHEAIVTMDEFTAVQEINASRRTNSSPRRQPAFPWHLRGLLYCEQCGRLMSPSTTHHGKIRYRHYRCRSHAGGRPPCPRVSIQANEIEKYVVAQISELSPTMFRGVARREFINDFAVLWKDVDDRTRRACLPSVLDSVTFHAAEKRIRVKLLGGAVGGLAGAIAAVVESMRSSNGTARSN